MQFPKFAYPFLQDHDFVAVSWPSQSPFSNCRGLCLDLRPVLVEIMADRMALEQIFLWVIQFSHIGIISPVLHTFIWFLFPLILYNLCSWQHHSIKHFSSCQEFLWWDSHSWCGCNAYHISAKQIKYISLSHTPVFSGWTDVWISGVAIMSIKKSKENDSAKGFMYTKQCWNDCGVKLA
jgi:hypothetical protein